MSPFLIYNKNQSHYPVYDYRFNFILDACECKWAKERERHTQRQSKIGDFSPVLWRDRTTERDIKTHYWEWNRQVREWVSEWVHVSCRFRIEFENEIAHRNNKSLKGTARNDDDLIAFKLGCQCRCGPLWWRDVDPRNGLNGCLSARKKEHCTIKKNIILKNDIKFLSWIDSLTKKGLASSNSTCSFFSHGLHQ